MRDIIGYDPQRLLADQRGTLKRWADDYREIDYSSARLSRDQFRDMFPDTLKAFTDKPLGEPYDPTKHFPAGGSPTGRWRTDHMPWMLPRDEAVLPKDHPIVATDFGEMEARVLAHMEVPTRMYRGHQRPIFTARLDLSVEGVERMNAAFRRVAEAAREASEKMLLLALYGGTPFTRPRTPDEKRGRRILDLMGSPDRRQKKRGNRLFRQWMRSRPGINWSY